MQHLQSQQVAQETPDASAGHTVNVALRAFDGSPETPGVKVLYLELQRVCMGKYFENYTPRGSMYPIISWIFHCITYSCSGSFLACFW